MFVVIGRNEGERLRSCLESVRAVSDRIIYADSASRDGSRELARSLGALVVEVAWEPLNAARGRNEGLAAAREHFPEADFVQFLDGDCILQRGWANIAIEFLDTEPKAAAVCGRRFEAFPGASFYNRLADAEWDTPVGTTLACGGDAMMRIAAITSVGGFDSQLMAGEEPELCARLRANGWTIWRLRQLMSEHDAAIFRLGQWWRRTVRSGFGYAQVWQKTRHGPEALYGRQLRSALFWAVLFPSFILLWAALLQKAAILLLVPIGYAAQIARIAARRRGSLRFRTASGALLLLAKFAELLGAARYLLSKSYSKSIEYKRSPS